jgi:tRNA 2-selenouridine synthase
MAGLCQSCIRVRKSKQLIPLIHQQQIEDWLQTAERLPVFDVRSPGEHTHAHFPGATSLPLLNDEERAIVGTLYKQEGNQAAVLKGYELVGHKFQDYLKQALVIAPSKEVAIYCWRGGLRSNIMAFLLHTAGFTVHLLKGGYKAYRTWVLETLNTDKKLVVVGGKTGTGKTQVLTSLAKSGEQVIDLEQLCNHKGSAFGGLGQPPQPGYEQFENILAMKWHRLDPNRITFIENESRTVGHIKIPDQIFTMMRNASTFDIQLPDAIRISNILNEYGQFSKEELAACTSRLLKRLGHLRLQQALALLEEGRMEEWIKMLLVYYDENYAYGNSTRKEDSIIPIIHNKTEPDKIAAHILDEVYNKQKLTT